MDDIPKNLIVGLLIPIIKEIVVNVVKKYLNEKHLNDIDVSNENLEYLYKIAEIEARNKFTEKTIEVAMNHET